MAVRLRRSSSRLKDYEAVSMKNMDKELNDVLTDSDHPKVARIVHENGTL